MVGLPRVRSLAALCLVVLTACSGPPATTSATGEAATTAAPPAATTPSTTASTTTTVAPTTFAVIGDYGDGRSDERGTAEMIERWFPDDIVTAGDNVYGSTNYDEMVGQFFSDFIGSYAGEFGSGAVSNHFFPALGNHDYSDGGLDAYEDYFTLPGVGYTSSSGNERYYNVVVGPVHWFFVNSNKEEPDGIDAASRQASWLRSGLTASVEPWQVVVFHHAPYGSTHHKGTEELRWPFAQWGADLVLNGHNHNYERFSVDGIIYVTVGLGVENEPLNDKPLDPHSVFFFGGSDVGALRLTACAGALIGEFVTVDAGPIDRFSIGSGSCPG